MNSRFVVQVCQLDPLWRVTVRDSGRQAPVYCRDYPCKDEAVSYARGRALQLLATTEEAVSVVLLSAGVETVLWNSSGELRMLALAGYPESLLWSTAPQI